MGSQAVPTHNRTARFFVLVFVWTWGLQLPAVWAQFALPQEIAQGLLPLAMLGIFGPGVVAFWLTRRELGPAAARRLLGDLRRGRASWMVYLVGAVLPVVLLSAGLLALRPFGYAQALTFVPPVERLLVGLVISAVEELGWRGYALPRLQSRYGALPASGILAVFWTLWHIPMFLGQGFDMSLMPVIFLELLGGSIVFTWVYNCAQGQLLPLVLAHFAVHLNNPHLALPTNTVPLLVHSVIMAALGLVLVRLDKRVFPEAQLKRRTHSAVRPVS